MLVDLRGLRQGKELPGMRTAGHQVIARPFRGGLRQHGRLDVDEPGLIQILTHGARDPVAQHQALAHLFAAQIQVTEAQPHLFTDGLVELKGQRFRAVQNLQILAQHFDLPGFQVGVCGAGRPGPHQPRHLEHEFIAHAFRRGKHVRLVRIENDLQQALAISQIDENDPTVITSTLGPAGHGDRLADQRLVDQAAIMSAHKQKQPKWGKRAMLRLRVSPGKSSTA